MMIPRRNWGITIAQMVRTLTPCMQLLCEKPIMSHALRKAHRDNDRAVMHACGFAVGAMDEPARVAAPLGMYRRLTAGK